MLVIQNTILLLRIFVLVFFLAIPAASVAEDTRVALVIGNSGYERVSSLPNTTNDSRDLADALERIGFQVTRGLDLSFRDMRIAIRDFAEAAADAKVVVVYFAGHGIEIDNTNYLIPIDAELQSDRDIELEAIRLDTLIGSVSGGDGLKIILIDACRNNPFVPNMARTSSTRSVGHGLARIDPSGVLVGYAARSGTLALDGNGRNSPYAQALLNHIEEPGLELGKMFRKVRDTVFDLTDGYQEPFTYGSLPGHDIYLVSPPVPHPALAIEQTALTPRSPDEEAEAAWDDFRDSTSPDALEAFAKTYPDTAYAALALSIADRYRENTAQTLPPADLPKWCNSPKNETQSLICRDPDLLKRDSEVSELFQRRLDAVRSGAARGQALVEQRNWRLSRDECGSDPTCIAKSYKLRKIALVEFDDAAMPTALVVRSIQEELNRMSCGAGEPDGVIGAQTRNAYDLAASLLSDIETEAALDDIRTLNVLRAQPTAECSFLKRAVKEPKLLEGIWKIRTVTCPGEAAGFNLRRIQLKHDGDGVYSGRLAYENGAFKRAIGAQLSDRVLSLTHVTTNGSRQSYFFEPADVPNKFVGSDWSKCTISVSR